MRLIVPLVAWLWLSIGHVATAAPARAKHVRIETPNGPVHVWTPRRFDPETAGVVVYVHGYFTTADRAWRQHRLARQFAASNINAVFVVCEGPTGPDDPISWPNLGELLTAVSQQFEDGLPTERVVAVGHSGAHRTITAWLGESHLDTIVLVDAYYGDMPGLQDWLAASEDRRLIDVGAATRKWTDELHAALPETVAFERFPSRRMGRLFGARDARIVYVRTELDHMALVTDGLALPMVLRALQLDAVSNGSLTAPL